MVLVDAIDTYRLPNGVEVPGATAASGPNGVVYVDRRALMGEIPHFGMRAVVGSFMTQ